MLAKVVAWAPTRDGGAAPARRRARARRDPRRAAPTATCSSRCCGTRRSVAARPRHRLPRAARPRRARRPAGRPRDASRVAAFAAAVDARRAGPGRARRAAPGSRPAGATWSPSRSAPSSRTTATRWSPSGTAAATATAPRDGLRAELSGGAVVLAVVDASDSSAARRCGCTSTATGSTSSPPLGHVALTVVPRFVDPADQVASGSLLAPMPGSVVRLARRGRRQPSPPGEPVLVLEAMKMQHTVTAPHDGDGHRPARGGRVPRSRPAPCWPS